MRLRIIDLPNRGLGSAPYMLVIDRVSEWVYENRSNSEDGSLSDAFVKNSKGQCHGVIFTTEEVVIESGVSYTPLVESTALHETKESR